MLQDKLLDIVTNNGQSEYDNIIASSGDGRLLYHLSHIRANVVEWLPINSCDTVLEIGSETGAITGMLASKAGKVTCIEVNERNNCINRARNGQYDNITYITSKYSDVTDNKLNEKMFDYVLLINPVIDNVNSINSSGQALVDYAYKHLKEDGKLVIAADNRFGLKFFAGNREEYSGKYFEGITGKNGITRNDLAVMASKIDLNVEYYYPYPDYRLPLAIYSENFLPKYGELTNNYRNFDSDRIYLFDENKAFDAIINDGQFEAFANSYIAVMQKRKVNINGNKLIFAKYSNDRAEQFNIRTDICQNSTGYLIHKTAFTGRAQTHIDNIYDSYNRLKEKYAGFNVEFNVCNQDDTGIELEYLTGKTLDEVIIDNLNRHNFASVKAFVRRFIDLVRYNSANNVWDVDMIFKNIVVSGEDIDSKWTVIDYEWTFEKDIPAEFIIYRSLYYLLADNKRDDLQDLELMQMAGITEQHMQQYEQYEKEFQAFVSHDHRALGEIYPKVAGTVYDVRQIVGQYIEKEKQDTIDVYGVCEDGIREAIETNIIRTGETFNIEMLLNKSYDKIIIQPAHCWCLVNIVSMSVNCEISHNGMHINNGMYAFKTMNPEISMCGMSDVADIVKVELMVSNQGAGTSSTFDALINESGLLVAKAHGVKGIVGFAYNKISKMMK